MFGHDINEYLVVEYVFYDWNLYSFKLVSDFSTQKLAEEFIKLLKEQGDKRQLDIYKKI